MWSTNYGLTVKCAAILLTSFLLTLVLTSFALSDNVPNCCTKDISNALPNQECKAVPLAHWNNAETWAWSRICQGSVANFNERPSGCPLVSIKLMEDKNICDRILTAHFLETILLDDSFQSSSIRPGVHIIGAYFPETLDLSDATIDFPLRIEQSEFGSTVNLQRLKTSSFIGLSSSHFKDLLNMRLATIQGPLFLNDGATFREVELSGAHIGEQLSMESSTFEGTLSMESISVAGDLQMGRNAKEGNAQFHDVALNGAKIDASVYMAGSSFAKKLDMNTINISGSLYMNERAKFGEVELTGARIGGQVNMDSSKFNSKLIMDTMTVGRSLLMRDQAVFSDNVYLNGAKIGGEVSMRGSRYDGVLHMDAVTIEGRLRMHSLPEDYPDQTTEFTGVLLREARIGGEVDMSDAKFMGKTSLDFSTIGSGLVVKNAQFEHLSLRHTRARKLQVVDSSTWPMRLDLNGFTYSSIDWQPRGDDGELGELAEWLGKHAPLSPQPYWQLASVLRNDGREGMADRILVAYHDRELQEASVLDGKWWRLVPLKYLIGYGYGGGYFRALLWAALFVAIGTIVLNLKTQRQRHKDIGGVLGRIVFSVDMLLPVIRLRERHYTEVDLKGGARYYFYVHKVLGYILTFFVIAGLSGVTS